MEKKQRINRNVENCKHNGGNGCCVLDSITVVNSAAAPTAHYCYDYQEEVFR